ncbi:MAG: hypothetical protein HZY79_09350 [Rhodoblastus sp.]|nr:MAG: hypothetical protein HZY79_09350 [Rhodoblastus sp.]
MTRGAFGAGVLKLGAALSVWVGGGEPLAMFVATSLILPLPLALASGLWNRHMRGDPDGGFSIPYWPTMLLAFTLIAPRTDVGLALARAWS